MAKEIINLHKQTIAYFDPRTPQINLGNFLDLLANADANIVAIHRECLEPNFFDLKTLVAGEMFQKITNYHKQLIILGDFTDITSQSFKDLMYEANKNGQTIFAKDLVEAAN
ncbi:DUF4180 domain-containing protein [Candidatus Kuenenbacteria bacterium]|nr:DUF4180 domain-containing protein [Candidatus Kuenenbacteria bacterium]